MNAIIQPKKSAKKLNRQEKRTIVFVATRAADPLPVRADRLKSLSFCTDDVKFEVLKNSPNISDDLYDCLFRMYFGVGGSDSGYDREEPTETLCESDAAAQERNDGKKTEKSDVYKNWTEEESLRLINNYVSGAKAKELAAMFSRTVKSINSRIDRMKKDGKYKHLFENREKKNMNNSDNSNKTVDDLTAADELITADTSSDTAIPKVISAKGTGFLTTDGGLKLNEEPITKMLRQKIIEEGFVQFYAEVEIRVRPVDPVGMVVTVEE